MFQNVFVHTCFLTWEVSGAVLKQLNITVVEFECLIGKCSFS